MFLLDVLQYLATPLSTCYLVHWHVVLDDPGSDVNTLYSRHQERKGERERKRERRMQSREEEGENK